MKASKNYGECTCGCGENIIEGREFIISSEGEFFLKTHLKKGVDMAKVEKQEELTLPETESKVKKVKKERKQRTSTKDITFQISKLVPYTQVTGKKAAQEITDLLGEEYVATEI